jgi:hypothetical protein
MLTKEEWVKESFGMQPFIYLIVGLILLSISIILFLGPLWRIGFIVFWVSIFPLGIFGVFKVFEASK